MKNQNLIITGATGLVGQHLLYDLLRKFIEEKKTNKIIVLIRGRNQAEAEQRLINILSHDKIPDYLKDYDLPTKRAFFEVIVWQLGDSLVFPSHLQLSKSYCLIHLASSLKLSRDEKMYGELRKTNLEGTLDLVKQLSRFLKKVVFIGTAYTLSDQQEIIENPDILGDRTYRNPYERVKVETEAYLKDYCRAINLEIQIIRLNTICGRLIDTPLYYTSKFDVFYGFACFFYLVAQTKKQEFCRLFANPEAHLNITSCDYAAKAILAGINSDLEELTVAQSQNLLNYIPTILNKVGFNNYEIVERIPTNLNKVERRYYRVFGLELAIYTFYKYCFDTSALLSLMSDTPEPDVVGNFENIIEYANQNKYKSIKF